MFVNAKEREPMEFPYYTEERIENDVKIIYVFELDPKSAYDHCVRFS